MTDVIDELAGLHPGSRTAALRAQRPDTTLQAQRTYDALFSPVDDSAFPVVERLAVAAFVAGLHEVGVEHYLGRLRGVDPSLADAVDRAVGQGRGTGPYGSFAGELAAESVPGDDLALSTQVADALGTRLAVALGHAHLLVLDPRDAAPERLRVLADAGWSADGIVTLSQLVSFLSFQLRLAAGLAVLASEEEK